MAKVILRAGSTFGLPALGASPQRTEVYQLQCSAWSELNKLGAAIERRGVDETLAIIREWLPVSGKDAPLLKSWAAPKSGDSELLRQLKQKILKRLISSSDGEVMTVQKVAVLNARDTLGRNIGRGLYCYADLVRYDLITENQAVKEIVKFLDKSRSQRVLKAWDVVRWANHVLYGHPESWAHARSDGVKRHHGKRQEVFETFARGIREKMLLPLQQEMENRARFIVREFDEGRGIGALTALVTRGVYQATHVARLTINWTQGREDLRLRLFQIADFQLRVPRLRRNVVRHAALFEIRAVLHPYIAPQLGTEIPPLGDPPPFKNWGGSKQGKESRDPRQGTLF